jgi:hypothetical protein
MPFNLFYFYDLLLCLLWHSLALVSKYLNDLTLGYQTAYTAQEWSTVAVHVDSSERL